MKTLVLLASLLVAAAQAQQVADSNYDVSVKKPTYGHVHPKVLFDEAHNNFHTTIGRYKPFADLMRNDGFHITPSDKPFGKETLQGYKILVIANARAPKGGGSLLLIADHAPMGYNAEILAKRFSVDMSKGFTADEKHCKDKDETTLIYSRENGLLGKHEITKGINTVVAFTGQSLSIPKGASVLLQLASTATDRQPDIERSQKENRMILGDSISAKGRAQGIAFQHGKGRVVILGEAAMLTAQVADGEKFGMNAPGNDNRQFALNIMHWLAR